MSQTNTPSTSRYEYPLTEFDRPRDKRVLVFGVSALVVIIDRITKYVVSQQLPTARRDPRAIPGIFRISDVHNTGAAFSMFAENASPVTVRNILIAFSVAAVIILFGMLWRVGRYFTLTSLQPSRFHPPRLFGNLC